MEEKKEFLTEENYERGKKKLKAIALIILIVGILLGGSLIATGINKSKEAKAKNEETAQQTEESNKARTAEEIKADIEKVEAQIEEKDQEIKNLEKERTKLSNEQTKIFQSDRGFSDRYYAKGEEIDEKEDEIDSARSEKTKLQKTLFNYESELMRVESGFESSYNDVQKRISESRNSMSSYKYVPFYIFGGFIIIASCMISFSIYMVTKRREIAAFTAQQVMPVAQEGIEKMSPTIGKSAGSIAQGIIKGIKDGMKDSNEKE